MAEPDDTDSNSRQVVARVAAILEALGQQPDGMSLGQIAAKTRLPRSTVQRISRALELQGLALAGRGGVRLGPAITRLAASAHVDIAATAMPFIDAASRRTRETVELSVFRGAHALSVYQHASDQELRVVSPVGTAFPVHCTAHGKALLADMSDAEVMALLKEPLERKTPKTKTRVKNLLVDLQATRDAGLALDIEEHALGVCGLGLTLKGRSTERYALSMAVPHLRFDDRLDELKSSLLRCKAEIEEAIGSAA